MIADGLDVSGGGPYYLSWAPGLTPGVHIAVFQFSPDYGQTLEYTWQFIIEK